MENGSLLKSYLIGQLAKAKELACDIGPEANIEVLHHFRVALRRFRSVVDAYTHKLSAQNAVAKSMLKVTNPLRETDVFLASVDPAMYPKLFALITSYRERQYKKVWKADTAKRFTQALEHLIAGLSELELNPSEKKLVRTGKHLYDAVKKEHKALTKDSDEEVIHDVRLHYKQVRYVLEFLDEAGLLDAEKKIKKAKKAQDHFGAIQDAVNQLEWLHRFCKKHPSDECSALYEERKKALKELKKAFEI